MSMSMCPSWLVGLMLFRTASQRFWVWALGVAFLFGVSASVAGCWLLAAGWLNGGLSV